MRPRPALAFVVALWAGGCGALADLPDWEMGSADAATDAGGTDATSAVDAEDATSAMDAQADADAGCPLGCPRAAYDFDEDSGVTTRDRSGHGNTGFLQDSGPTWSAGVAGGALTFDGVDDVVDVPASASLDISGTGLSILFWAKIDDTKMDGRDHVLVNKAWAMKTWNDPFYQYGVEFGATPKTFDLYFGVGDTDAGRRGPFRMSFTGGSEWTHVAFTYDGERVRGYLGGTETFSESTDGGIVSRPDSGLWLGLDATSKQPFKGAMDDLRIYDRALPLAEIQALRDAHREALADADGTTNACIESLVVAGHRAASHLEDSHGGEVRTKSVEIVEVTGQHDAPGAGRRRHDDAVRKGAPLDASHGVAGHLGEHGVERFDAQRRQDLLLRVRAASPPLRESDRRRDQRDPDRERRAPEGDRPLVTSLDADQRAGIEGVPHAALFFRRRTGVTNPSVSITIARATAWSSGPNSSSSLTANAPRCSSIRRSSAASPIAAETLPPWSLLARLRKTATSFGLIEMLNVTVSPARFFRDFIMFQL